MATSSTISTSSRWIHSIELQLQQLRLRRAGEAVADAAKMSWENLAQQTLSGPLSMTETSYRQSDYDRAPRPHISTVSAGTCLMTTKGGSSWELRCFQSRRRHFRLGASGEQLGCCDPDQWPPAGKSRNDRRRVLRRGPSRNRHELLVADLLARWCPVVRTAGVVGELDGPPPPTVVLGVMPFLE